MKLVLRSTEQWIYGLASVFISGAATAMDAGLGLVVMDPADFNLGAQLGSTLRTVLVIGLISGARQAIGFLKAKPLPVWDGIDTRRRSHEPSVTMQKKTETVVVNNPQLMGPEVVAQVTEKP
jgi:hypothetical protein